jgi:ATP-dependent Clp protease protease subunit
VWLDPGERAASLHDRLLEQRIIIANGWLDGEAATRLSAQLLTLDAEGTQPIRLELQGMDAELPAALSVMGVLDTLRAPVSAYVGGRISGPAVGMLAAAPQRYAYPNALLVLSEPHMGFEGTVNSVAAQEQQLQIMLGELHARLAEVTGREVEQIRADCERQTSLTVPQAIDYGLLTGPAAPRKQPRAAAG